MKRMASLLVITRRLKAPLERWRKNIRDRLRASPATTSGSRTL